MVARRRLDSKARTWLAVLVILLLALPILALRSCIAMPLDDNRIVISPSVDDRLVSFKNGSTMLLEHDSLGRKIADWLHVGTTTEHRFAVGDETFAAGTAEPTRDGSVHVVQFAQVLRAHPGLNTRILITQAADAKSRAEDELEHLRAARLRRDVIAQGVSASKITAVDQPVDVRSRRTALHPHLLVVIERAIT